MDADNLNIHSPQISRLAQPAAPRLKKNSVNKVGGEFPLSRSKAGSHSCTVLWIFLLLIHQILPLRGTSVS